MDDAALLEAVRDAMAADPRIDLASCPVALAIERGALVISGAFRDIAAKKLALERAAAVPGVAGIVDRAHTVPATAMGDAELRDHLARVFTQEPVYRECSVTVSGAGELILVHAPAGERRGAIAIEIADGVVSLQGEVPSLSHKRLAGVLAWWVPGTRDVINGLGVEPEEQDSDDEITDAVQLALEKDPFVNAANVHAQTADAVVTLTGVVPSESERRMAEFDAWYVLGVNDVINRVAVRPG